MSNEDVPPPQEAGVVLLKRRGPVAELILSRPAALNAMTWAMYQQLERHLDELSADDDVRVIVLRGDGERAFAAGTDIQQFQGFTGESGVAYEQRVDAIMERLASVPKPLIAAIRGYAVGGGLVLAAACDLRYATPTAQFGIPVGRTLGNCLSLKNYQRVATVFGLMRAKEMLFTGRLLSAEEALQAGFVTALVGEEELLPRVHEVAESISQNAPLTIWATKQAYVRLQRAEAGSVGDVPFEDVIARVYGSEDFQEGVMAHVQKRRPRWQGR